MSVMAVGRAGLKAPSWKRLARYSLAGALLAGVSLQGCTDEEITQPHRDSRPVSSSLAVSGGLRDDFTDTDGTLLQNHTPDGGTVPFSWKPATSWGGELLQATIQSNGVTSIPDMDWVYLTSVQGGDEAGIDVEVFGTPPSGKWQEIAIYFRTQDADVSELNGYIGPLWSLGSDSSFLEIQRPAAQGGVVIQRAGPVAAGSHSLRAKVNTASELEVTLDGVFMGKAPLENLPPPAHTGLGTWGIPVARVTSFSDASSQSVNVTCAPANPTRGATVSCKTSLASVEPYSVTRRTARGKGFTVEDTTSVSQQAGDTNTWDGPAVASTDVTVEVRLQSGQTLTNQTPGHFEVQARGWPTWKLTTLAAHVIAIVAPYMTQYPLPDTSDFGLFDINWQDFNSPTVTPTIRPNNGPNKGVVYLQNALDVTRYTVYTHPALYPPTNTTPKPSKSWYQDQNGRGSGTCGSSGIALLASNVERHEGKTQAQNSHFGVANKEFALLQPQFLMERQYSQADEATFRRQVFDSLDVFLKTGAYNTAHDSFDLADIPNVYALGCTLDFNLNDR